MKKINWRFTLSISFFCIFYFVFFSIYFLNFSSYDGGLYRYVTGLILSGKTPYVEGFFNPPWALIPIIPLLRFPGWLADGLLTTLNAVCILAVAWKRGARGWLLAIVFLAPCIIAELRSANITGITALGIILPPQIGLFFILLKPQLGFPIAIFWFVEAWRKGHLREVIRVFAPVSIAFIISFALFGLWPLNSLHAIQEIYNMSPWPAGIPIGLLMLLYSFRTHEIRYAMFATPFLTPYLAFHGYSIAFLGLLPIFQDTIIVEIGLWLFLLINGGWGIRKF